MKGIILAGGTGSRLHPLTVAVNKHLLPIGSEPMVLRCVNKLVEAGISDIVIVTNPEYVSDFSALLGSGKKYKCNITYKVQDEPGGVAQALGVCEDFVGTDECCVLLGDNMFSDCITDHVESFKQGNDSCHLFFKHVPDGHRYGVGTFDDGKLVKLVEKPEGVMGAYAAVGIYLYRPVVFDVIKKIKPSYRNELEITSVNASLMETGDVSFSFLSGWWTDAGTMETYLLANRLVNND